ncbi:hypothetical protein, partial [Escherichia coli]|uniref:hypothetical protein n=1 Tax=Escherichia coli TaxID=562 RepID=UPI001BFC6376
ADRNRSHWSTSKTPSYTKSVSWQHHQKLIELLEKQSGLHTSVDCSTPLTEQSLSRNDGEDQTRRNAENMFGDD